MTGSDGRPWIAERGIAHSCKRDCWLMLETYAGGYFALALIGAGSIALFGGNPIGIFAYFPDPSSRKQQRCRPPGAPDDEFSDRSSGASISTDQARMSEKSWSG